MPRKECCLWNAEQTDDTLKTLFQADEAYSNGNKTKALAYLKAQSETKLPIIEAKARKECGRLAYNPTKMLQNNMRDLAMEMHAGSTPQHIHNEVMKIDKRYAEKGYMAFSRCMV